MAGLLDLDKLKCSSPQEASQYLQSVADKTRDGKVTDELMSVIETGSLPPSVFEYWLNVSCHPGTIREALQQTTSVEVRRQAIKQLGKRLASSKWRDIWDGIGGVRGILTIFKKMSVREVKDTCRAIVRGAKGIDLDEKRRNFSELFQAFVPHYFRESLYSTEDQRQLRRMYDRLIPACTEDLVTLAVGGHLQRRTQQTVHGRLLLAHADTLRAFALRYVFADDPIGKDFLSPLVSQYPSQTTSKRGFSASMAFCLDVLRKIVKEGTCHLSHRRVVTELAEPLLKRAIRKKAEWSTTEEIVDLIIAYLDKVQEARRGIKAQKGSVLHLVALCWARKPDIFESSLSFLLSSHLRDPEQFEIKEFEPLLFGVAKSRRYTLLRFCFKTVTGRDLEVEKDLVEIPGILPYTLMHRLGSREALGLLQRLRTVRGNEALVEQTPYLESVLSYPPAPGLFYGDSDIWHITLLEKNNHQEEANNLATSHVDARKRSAISNPEPEQRAFWAKSALNYAVASGSLDLFKKTLDWARRFVRDPVVAAELYQAHVPEVKSLLSGIPNTIDKSMTPLELGRRVQTANQILIGIFDTACLALREPSFSDHHWSGSLMLFFDVVDERVRQSSTIQKKLGATDDLIYQNLWEDTVEMLLVVEKKALELGHDRLMANSVQGILNYQHHPEMYVVEEERSLYCFFDNLAKARDQLWRKHRPSIYPAAASLFEPFPLGLPIQHLIQPYSLEGSSLQTYAPYIASRIDAAVFPSSRLALTPFPEDEETKTAVGIFIDDYYFALNWFISAKLDEAYKIERVQRAWAHAIGPLSQDRMTSEEADRYWRCEAWSYHRFGKETLEAWPLAPHVDQPNGVEEWNPFPVAGVGIQNRTLDRLTYIDVSKDMSRILEKLNIDTELDLPTPTIHGFKDSSIWSDTRIRYAKGRSMIREGQILSAMLYLDSFNAAESRILAKPFPSGKNPRYPAIYLDEAFLSNKKLERDDALSALRAHIWSVPADLLAHLTANAIHTLDALDSTDRRNMEAENLAFRLVQLLEQSDRPTLASKHAIRLIIDRPDASSWHRLLLSPGYLRRLPSSDAQACITSLYNAIITQFSRQRRGREDEQVGTTDKPEEEKHPLLKITTIKLLAQLLGDTEYISEKFALSILSNLLEKASHVDVQRAIVNSLLNMFEAASPESVENIISTLEVIVPIAGNLRERRPITEAEWKQAEESLSPPEIGHEELLPNKASILNSVVVFLKRLIHQPKTPHRGAFFRRIILPIIRNLKQQTARWVSIFLRKYGFDHAEVDSFGVPSLAGDKSVAMEFLLKGSSDLPLSVLEEHVQYMTFNIALPAPLKKLNVRLEEDESLQDEPDVKAWLARFGEGTGVVSLTTQSLTRLLNEPSQLNGEITPKAVQAQYLTLYTALLWNDDAKQENLWNITNPLWHFSFYYPVAKDWGKYYKPIVEALTLYVEGQRTKDWRDDPNRQPQVLPDTFRFRLWILQYSAQHSAELDAAGDSGDREPHCKAFAARVAKITDQIAGSLYHFKFTCLKEAIKYLRDDDRLRVACYLGDIQKTRLSWLTMQDHLRVELAASLLESEMGGSTENKELQDRVEALRESWRKAESEEVRRLGFDVEEMGWDTWG